MMSESQISVDSSLFECAVCFEILNETSKMLECQHTFHRQCLLNISVRNPSQLRCPTCRLIVRTDINLLPPNLFITCVLDQVKMKSKLSESGSRYPGRHSEIVTLKNNYSSQLDTKKLREELCLLKTETETLKNETKRMKTKYLMEIDYLRAKNHNVSEELKNVTDDLKLSKSKRTMLRSRLHLLRIETDDTLKRYKREYSTEVMSLKDENEKISTQRTKFKNAYDNLVRVIEAQLKQGI